MMEGNIFSILDSATEKLKEVDPETLKLVKETVARDASDEELALFMYMCYRYNLDPLLGEIYFMKTRDKDRGGEKPSFIVSRDGYLKIAMSHPDFQGLNSFVVREGDVFEVDAEKGTVHHRFGSKRGEIIGAWAISYRRGFKPQIAFVEFAEYFKPKSRAWKQYPSAMIQKVAEVFVLRRHFNITGVVTREEIGLEDKMSIQLKPKKRAIILEGQGSISSPSNARTINNIELKQVNNHPILRVKEILRDEGVDPTRESILRKAKEMMMSGDLSEDEYAEVKKEVGV